MPDPRSGRRLWRLPAPPPVRGAAPLRAVRPGLPSPLPPARAFAMSWITDAFGSSVLRAVLNVSTLWVQSCVPGKYLTPDDPDRRGF